MMIAQSELVGHLNSGLFWLKRKNNFGKTQQIEFIEQLNSYLARDIGLKESLESVSKQYSSIYGDKHVVPEIANQLRDAVIAGQGFDELLRKYFNPVIGLGFELAKQISGDKSGVLNVVRLLKDEADIKFDAIMKLALPLMLFVFGIVSQVVAGGFIIPMINPEPPSTFEINLALNTSELLQSNWPFIALIAGFVVLVFTHGQASWRRDGKFGHKKRMLEDVLGDNGFTNNISIFLGRARAKIDDIWPFALFREFWSVRVLRLLGHMKLAQTEDIEALRVIKGYAPPAIHYFLDHMIRGAGIGTDKSEYFAKGLISPALMVRLQRYFINVDNETFARGLIEVSEDAEKDIKMQTRRAVTKVWLLLFASGFFLIMLSMSAIIQIFSKSFL